MKILVTGGCGFIGSNFVRHWRTTHPEDEIVVLDKLTYAGHTESLREIDFTLIQGDICDPKVVAEAMQGVAVVVHFAAESHVDRSIVGPSVFVQTNVIGTQVLLEEARRQNIELFHHVSTDEVFGSLPLDRPDLRFDEGTPYAPHSPYAASKASSDHLVRAYHDTYGLPITITNTSNNYGPYQDPEKLIPRFITNLLTENKVPLMGRGENVRDWCYVSDHCDAIDKVIHAALQNPEIIGQTFCVGGNSEKSNREVTEELLRICGKDDTWIEHIPHRLGHDARYAINSAKISEALGWSPSHDFSFWLQKTVEWYKENESWWKPLQKGRPLVDPDAQLSKVVTTS
jgi:dTDP-glucose 4,6-dehydratase